MHSSSAFNRESIHRGVNSFSKEVQRNWFSFWTIINNLPRLTLSLLKVLCLLIGVVLSNFFVTSFVTKLLGQITVGVGGNIMWWHHPYIQPDLSNNKEILIPKTIHQTYKTFDSVPMRWKNGINLWQKYHPDWEYKFWSDDDLNNFMAEHYSWFIPFYYLYPNHIQRVDVSRYFILYHYGGVYADLDISPKQNIEPLLSNNIENFLVETPNLGTTNSLFGAVKHSKFLFFVINNLAEYQGTGYYQAFLPNHAKILMSTGPTAFWALYGRYYSEGIGPETTFGILDNKYFGRLAICFPNPGESSTFDVHSLKDSDVVPDTNSTLMSMPSMISFEDAYFYHVEGNSWHNPTSWYINYFLGCQPITTLFMFAIIVWILYCGFYKHKYLGKRSISVWCQRHSIIIAGSTLLILSMFFWRSVVFYLQKYFT